MSMISRYLDSAIDRIFDRETQLVIWAEVEQATVAVRYGDDDAYRLSLVAPPSERTVRRAERAYKHEMVAFLTEWQRDMPTDLASKVHHGLTSSDVIDTATAMQVQQAMEIIMARMGDVEDVLLRTERSFNDVPQAARTHGQQATHRTGEQPWQTFHAMWQRQAEWLDAATHDAKVGKMSGPDGTYPVVTPDEEEAILNRLGLHSTASTQIVPRDLLARVCRELAALMTLVEAIATNLRLWSISEVGEFREGVGAQYVGSSSIPHKRNPATCEKLCGLARMARGYSEQIQLGVVQWWDRDLAHSSVERVFVPDLFHVTATALHGLGRVLDFGEWDHDRMYRNMVGFTDTAAELNERVEAGADRPGAHEELRPGR